MIAYFDTTGVQWVKEGNGFAIITDTDSIQHEEGRYWQGQKDSIWKGFYKEGGRYYEEVYNHGNLISGVQTLQNGNKLNYTQLQENPQFKGEMKQFYEFIFRNFVFPKDLRNRETDLRTMIFFNIQTDGNLTDIKTYPFISFSVDQEIKRVLNNSIKWIPAKVRGIPISSSYGVPFSLHVESRIRNSGMESRPIQTPRNTTVRRSF